MKLKKVHVRNFRSVRDSGEFTVEANTTCLVGKNEAGKTALLQALARVNPQPGEPSTFEKLDYPRDLWADFPGQEDSTESRNAIWTEWLLDDEETRAIEEIVGSRALQSRSFWIQKGYHKLHTWQFDVNEAEAVQHIVSSFGLPAEVATKLKLSKSIKSLHTTLGASTERSG